MMVGKYCLCFLKLNLYFSIRVENLVCAVKPLQLRTYFSNINNVFQAAFMNSVWCGSVHSANCIFTYSDPRLQWSHEMQRSGVLPETPWIHYMLDFRIIFGYCAETFYQVAWGLYIQLQNPMWWCDPQFNKFWHGLPWYHMEGAYQVCVAWILVDHRVDMACEVSGRGDP